MRRAVALCVAVIAGCATNSGVMPLGPDTYLVTREAGTGFSGTASLKADAFREAGGYCAKQGKEFQVVSTSESKPPFVFGNYLRAEVQFMCLAKGDRDLARPKMRPAPDTVIEVKQ
jgi:hypothetical protein